MSTPSRIRAHSAGIADRELLLSWCASCESINFPPRVICHACGHADEPTWKKSAGSGMLWSFAAFHKQYDSTFPLTIPYTVAVVELDEGVKIYANVVDTPTNALRVGARMRADYIVLPSGQTSLIFTPTTKDSSCTHL